MEGEEAAQWGSMRRARSVPRIPGLPGRWLQPSRPAPRNTNVRQIRLPGPGSGVGFHLDRYPCRPASAGALSWQHKPGREQTPAEALLPAAAPARPCVRLPRRGGSARAGRSTAAALSGSVMRKM